MRYREGFDGDDDDFSDREPRAGGQSVLGIASFLLALAAGILVLGLIVIACILEARSPGAMDDESPQAMLLGLGFMGGLFLDTLGIALGVAGLCQAHRNQAFAWLGVGIGGCVLLGGVFLIGLGILVG